MVDITLLALDRSAAERLASDAKAFAKQHGVVLDPHEDTAAAVAADNARFLASTNAAAPWVSYLALEGPTRRVVGTCAFKGGPDADAAVEIAYFTFPGEESRGVATSMAAALVELAAKAAPNVA